MVTQSLTLLSVILEVTSIKKNNLKMANEIKVELETSEFSMRQDNCVLKTVETGTNLASESLSKRAQKRLQKRKEWLETRPERRAKEKAKKKAKIEKIRLEKGKYCKYI